MSLVVEWLEQLKKEEEKITRQKIEAEERLSHLPKGKEFSLTKKEYLELRESLAEFIQTSTLEQKRTFLANFIYRIIVLPDRITIRYLPPTFFKKTKGPGEDRDLLKHYVASPRGFAT